MPGRPIVAFVLALAAGSAVAADEAPARYTLRYDAATETMAVRLCLPQAEDSVRFVADRAAAHFVDDLARTSGPAPARDRGGWSANGWKAGECLSYRAALGRIVDAGDRGLGARHGSAIVTDPDNWLLRTDDADRRVPAEVDVELPAGYAISAPWHPLQSSEGATRFSLSPTPKDWLARVAIGKFGTKNVALRGGTLRVSILDGADATERTMLDAWLAHVSRATLSAYGKLPLADVQVLIVPDRDTNNEAVGFGQSSRGQGHALTLFVDPRKSANAFDRDWVAVHELSHLFHPYLDDEGSWLAEGLATYYQNVLRARAGLLTPAEAWEQIDYGFARGRGATGAHDVPLGASGERPNFMRIYWSGTAYWLEVDTELRRTSGNKLDIDEALRRFDDCCLPSYRAWEPAEFVAKLDALLGTDVFRKHFEAYATRRDFPDLKPLYAKLGLVRGAGDTLTFDEAAPDAAVRRAIMAPR
ncbi:MAG TPA: hypothetical protein VFV97_10590 [Rhodanobacteraceae bacterium]|nr:hypothetical protein [Rhodanobacteraceae bacterium]